MKTKYIILAIILFINTQIFAQTKFSIGIGNNNLISDLNSLSKDKDSFYGEISGQIRFNIHLKDNYEFNFASYHRKYRGLDALPNIKYNKFLGYSAGVYYIKKNDSKKITFPLGLDIVSFKQHLDSIDNSNNIMKFEHIDQIGIGPKFGLRYYPFKKVFIDSEFSFIVMHTRTKINWHDTVDNLEFSLKVIKFVGLSINYIF